MFDSASVAYTPKTHHDTVTLLKDNGYSAFKAEDTVISSYQTALTTSIRSNVDRIFYCDLDRALHWIKTYPNELRTLAESFTQNDFVLIGRTKRAFETHPETQTLTEGVGNTLASKVLGFPETRDVLGTTWILTPSSAKKILEMKPSNRFGFYTEWPITLWRSARNPLYLECEGLEWETPDRYQQDITQTGYGAWKEKHQNVQEWKKRNLMLRDTIEAIATHIQFKKST